MGMGRRGVRILEEGRERKLPGLLYADNFVFCGDSEEDLRAILGRFVEVCRRRSQKVNAGKSKVMVMNGKEGLECEAYVSRISLNYGSEFKYLGCALDKSGTD